MLEKREQVLQLLDPTSSVVYFGYIDEGTDEPVDVLLFDHETWNDFGKPSTMTITMVPGDRLN